MKEHGVLLNVDICFKVVREDTALNYINENRKKLEQRGGDVEAELQTLISGSTVVTR